MQQEVFQLLRGISKDLGYSQQDVANHCGVSRITIQRFFSGKTEIGAKDFVKVLQLLGIDVVHLLKDYDHQKLNHHEESLSEKDYNLQQVHWWERGARGAV